MSVHLTSTGVTRRLPPIEAAPRAATAWIGRRSDAPRTRGPGRLPLRAVAVGLASAAGIAALAFAFGGVPRPTGAAAALWLPAAGALAAGGLAGFLAGLLGIGGSLVVVPALYLLLPAFGVPLADVPHAAIASALVAMLPSALCCTLVQHRRRALEHGWLRRLGPGAALGAAAGALFALQLRGPVLALLFVAQSLYYGWGLLRATPAAPGSLRGRLATRCGRCPAWGVGPLAGGFCACLGMGAGSLMVPYLAAGGVPLLKATATAAALNLCIAAGGALALVAMPEAAAAPGSAVCWPAALLVAIAGATAVPAGVSAAARLPLPLFRRALGAVNLLGATVLLVRTLLG